MNQAAVFKNSLGTRISATNKNGLSVVTWKHVAGKRARKQRNDHLAFDAKVRPVDRSEPHCMPNKYSPSWKEYAQLHLNFK